MDDARTYGIDANTLRGVFQRRASGEPNDAVLGGVICAAARELTIVEYRRLAVEERSVGFPVGQFMEAT